MNRSAAGAPPALTSAAELERAFQRRIYRFGVAFILLMAPIYIAFAVQRADPLGLLVVALVFGNVLATLALVQRKRDYRLGLQWLHGGSFAGVLAGAVNVFGIGSPAFWWLSVIPAVTLMSGLIRLGLLQTGIVILYVGMAFYIDTGGLSALEPQLIRLHVAAALSTVYVCAHLALAMFWRSQLQAALEDARRAALASADAKARFLATMSHEIRTPLAGIIGTAELLRAGRSGDAQRAQLAALQEQSAKSLLALINDVLDWSKLEAGKLELEQRPLSLRALVSEANELFAMTAFDKKIELTSSCNADVPQRLLGDATRIRQIVNNLVSNAVKFTDQGGVHLHVALAGAPPDGGGAADENRPWVRIEVADSGIGIAAPALAGLFDEFRQADRSIARRYGGSGLGLAISRELSALMGGRIEVTSQPGHGSTFSLLLPLQRLEGEPVEPAPQASPQLLLCSGNARLVRHLRSLLQQLHIEPRLLHGLPGDEDLQHCRQLLLDAALLAGEGEAWARRRGERGIRLGLLQTLAAEPAPAGSVVLFKPVRLSALQAFLLEPPPAGDAAQPLRQAGAAVPQPLRVLLCEDNPVNQIVAQAMLAELGAQVVLAGNGLEALEHLRSGARFDLALMDLQMPELDGLGATREWRRLEQSGSPQRLPIVCMTADTDAEQRSAAREAGMDDFLAKPFGMAELRDCLARCAQHSTA
jgi:signal transduction histidine kinase/CheY-like chemotaxis protein